MRGQKIPIKKRPPKPLDSNPKISWKKSSNERMSHVAMSKAMPIPNTPETIQVRRATVSVALSVAEGRNRL